MRCEAMVIVGGRQMANLRYPFRWVICILIYQGSSSNCCFLVSNYRTRWWGVSVPAVYIPSYCQIAFHLCWLVVSTPLKNIRQLGLLFPIYGKIKNVPNHQPVFYCWQIYSVTSMHSCFNSKPCEESTASKCCSRMLHVWYIYNFLPTFDHLGDFGGTLW